MDESEQTKNIFIIGTGSSGLGSHGRSRLDDYLAIIRAISPPGLTIAPMAFLPHRDDFQPQPFSESQAAALKTIAKTVWVLWAHDIERVWELLRAWSTQKEILKTACGKIIEMGFEQNHLTPEDGFRKIESWLIDPNARPTKKLSTNDSKSGSSHEAFYREIKLLLEPQSDLPSLSFHVDLDPEAAANLIEFVLPAISKDNLSNITSNWTAANLERSLRSFCKAMQHIFYRDPNWTMKIFLQWTRKKETVYSDLIAGTLEGIYLNIDGKHDFTSLEKQLMGLRASCREERVRKVIQRLIKNLRDDRSKARSETARRSPKRRNPLRY